MSFQPLFPIWVIIIGFVLILALLSWLEIRRPLRWRSLRLSALVLALLALMGILLQPSREQIRSDAPVLLLTADYESSVVDSLLLAHSDWEIYRTPGAATYLRSNSLEKLVGLSDLSHRIGALAGNGLPAYAWEYLPQKQFPFFPSALQSGMQKITQKVYSEGQVNQLEGSIYLMDVSRQLLLKDPEGPLDSTIVEPDGLQSFTLNFTPQEAGTWEYQLVQKDTNGQLLSEHILPIRVDPEKRLRVLILQAFPTFEVRYLKDFLADRGHEVAVRSQISRTNFRTEFANLPDRNLNRLSTALLDDFDLLIADAAAFGQLGRNDLNNLSTAVEQGLGFLGIVNGDDASFRRWLGLINVGGEPDSVRLGNNLTLAAYPVNRQQDREWYDLQRTANDRSVAAYFYRGRGKIGFQTTQESYAQLLRGDSLTYASLWMPVLEGTLRETYKDYTIELLSEFPNYTGEPLDFRITANQPLETVTVDDQKIAVREDPFLDNVWYGRFWPRSTGWHQIAVGEESLDIYSFAANAWPDLRLAQLRRQSLMQVRAEGLPKGEAFQQTRLEPVSRLWFYLLFLLSAGFLWLAPKL
ncbi:hypothetical protein [Flavilitoribacter nigricans]|uniref:Uncharacterized protein n=1 Tax=Flavilitoribacter nigricans (strain ATCC 23147 / DSM 23189 / NBRC 102662 / NCIMB 1420 / SS-2) TaxID=1122177 RepID=A0A2D0NE20_FLAN2|nr:hypothetical protein [Flavilitoribacter nigricans]PHN06648.1 hypothetical protein CRP01_10150 [Flavilitoribacter nigricans DSM 23189 = NBRC 102662]